MQFTEPVIGVLTIIALVALGLFAAVSAFKAFYRKVEQGQALIINKMNSTLVSFRGGFVVPVVHRAEIMDISLKTIEIDRRGHDGLVCQDNIRADIKVTFFVRVNQTEDDVLRVAQSVGCARASDQETIEELFSAKFSEALKTVGYGLDFVDLYDKRDQFKDRIIEVIGEDLNGYALEDAAIDYLEQTPLDSLDAKNILDAQGIRKITELTAQQHIHTNEWENTEKKQITKQNVEAKETILSLERQQAEAEARQHREIATLRAREKAEIDRVAAEEQEKAQLAQLKASEAVAVANENKQRQVQVAAKNRERVVAVETERVEKDRALEAIAREREVELNRIEKEKALEVERKEIQDTIRERVAVEKTVAEEEERIKDLRVSAEAKRQKVEAVIGAEAEAEQALVKDIKAAEAAEKAAAHKARERLVQAEAELEAADKEAKAKMRLAEGVKAEQAAPGLAEAQVKEADALATEKQGMAEVRVKEANAQAIEKEGQAEAAVLEQKLRAEAQGKQESGMAEVRVQEADALVIEKKALAEAKGIEEKLRAEAAGLTDKAAAMKALDDASRVHEEFRLRLEKEKDIETRGIEAQIEIAQAQARLLSSALGNANIDIVGGDGGFFEKFVDAISLGKSVDGFIDKSDTAQTVFKEYLEEGKSLPGDLKDVLSRPALSAGDIQSLSVTALLAQMLGSSGDEKEKAAIRRLLEEAKKLGLDRGGKRDQG